MSENKVAVRKYGEGDKGAFDVEVIEALITDEIRDKGNQ